MEKIERNIVRFRICVLFLSILSILFFTMTRVIPSIAGSPSERWDKVFEKDVLSRNADGTPRCGSFGVGHYVKSDLSKLHAAVGFDDGKFKDAVRQELMEKNLSTAQIDSQLGQLISFYKTAEDDVNKDLFVRKGYTNMYLIRRKGHYRYDPDHEFPHRISYEVVRKATDEENKNVHGVRTFTLCQTSHNTVM